MTNEEAIEELKEEMEVFKEGIDAKALKNPDAELKKVLEANDLAIKTLEQTSWIPVSERLPEDGTWNIWQSKTGAISIERYKEDAYNHFYPSGRFFSLEDAVAWMPLPERYKESEEENDE